MIAKIIFIGGGNMARSLIGGLIDDGHPPQHLYVVDTNEEQLISIKQHYNVQIGNSAETFIPECDCVVLSVKPQILHAIIEQYQESLLNSKALIVSIAAGITSSSIHRWLGSDAAIVRCMPNTPALVQTGASALYANAYTSDDQKALAESILRAVGVTLWLEDEDLLNAVTAISGSGPAYFFLLMEIMQKSAQALGLNTQDAHLLVVQTALGAAKMALQSSEQPAVLREHVTSKGGTTEAALDTLSQGNIEHLINNAIKAANTRSEELANLLDE